MVIQEKYFSFSFPRTLDLYFIVDTAAYRPEYLAGNASVESGLCVLADLHERERERKRVA